MEKYYSQIIGQPLTDGVGHILGRIFDVVINPDTGKVVGLLLAPNGQKTVAPIDIIAWNNAITIHSSEEVLEVEELQILNTVLKKNIRILKNRVVTKDGTYLGKVVDFAIDPKFFVLTKIFVAKTFAGIFFYERKIINQKEILEIKKEAVVIKSPIKTIPIKKLSIDIAPTA